MRVTTKMINNNMMANIANNKSLVDKFNDQYTTGQKIQKPSDDPIIAVRTLKLRQTMTEINQYVEKNIPDAMSWMDITSSALDSMDSIMTSIYGYLTQGATDILSTSERKTIAENLEQLKGQLYNEADANYSGRFVFTGFKTDTSATFQEKTVDLEYSITENFELTDIDEMSKVIGYYDLKDYDAANPDPSIFDVTPVETIVNKIQLGYKNTMASEKTDANVIEMKERIDYPDGSYSIVDYKLTDKNGEEIKLYHPNVDIKITANNDEEKTFRELGITVIEKSVTDRDAYDIEKVTNMLTDLKGQGIRVEPFGLTYQPEKVAIFIPETGEIILSSDAHNQLRVEAKSITVDYKKDEFEADDVRPEHYYTCKSVDKNTTEELNYVYEDQNIEYEINFGQNIVVNTQIGEAIGNNFARTIDTVLAIVNEVSDLEQQIDDAKMFLNSQDVTEEQVDALESMVRQLETQLTIKNKMMTQSFESALDKMKGYQSKINTANANLGSRYARLEMVETRLTTQYTDYEELLSENIDADLVETYINLNSANSIYEASLSATSKILQNSLLDFI